MCVCAYAQLQVCVCVCMYVNMCGMICSCFTGHDACTKTGVVIFKDFFGGAFLLFFFYLVPMSVAEEDLRLGFRFWGEYLCLFHSNVTRDT